VTDDFSTSTITYHPGGANPPQIFNGGWYAGSSEEPYVRIAGGTLNGATATGVGRCQKRGSIAEGYSQYVQIELVGHDVFDFDGFQPYAKLLMSSHTGLAIGVKGAWNPGTGYWQHDWYAYENTADSGTYMIGYSVYDVAKIVATRTANSNEYDVEWYINSILRRSATVDYSSQNWDAETFDIIKVEMVGVSYSGYPGTVGRHWWDDFATYTPT
jgi:hypothetical protein